MGRSCSLILMRPFLVRPMVVCSVFGTAAVTAGRSPAAQPQRRISPRTARSAAVWASSCDLQQQGAD